MLFQIYISYPVSSSISMLVFHPAYGIILFQIYTNQFTQNSVTFTMNDLQISITHHQSPIQQFFYFIKGLITTSAAYINFGTEVSHVVGLSAEAFSNLLWNFFP